MTTSCTSDSSDYKMTTSCTSGSSDYKMTTSCTNNVELKSKGVTIIVTPLYFMISLILLFCEYLNRSLFCFCLLML